MNKTYNLKKPIIGNDLTTYVINKTINSNTVNLYIQFFNKTDNWAMFCTNNFL
jgi:hypothetical protein